MAVGRKLIRIISLVVWAITLASIAPPEFSYALEDIDKITRNDRILVLAPHPDDETIGCAGIIQEALKAGADVHIAYLTNGDHNQFAFIVYKKRLIFRKNEFIRLGEIRRKEAIKAMQLLGVDQENLTFLGYPDFGTFAIFSKYWGAVKPFKSLLTRIGYVPYKTDLSFGAPYKGESILYDLKTVILSYRPNKIFVSHPADVNVDHKALYLFLEVALSDLERRLPRPKVYPYLVHCIGWPLPRHFHPQLGLEPPAKFLDAQINWLRFELGPEQLEQKHQAILCYKSQTETSAFYLLAFARKNELFGSYSPIGVTTGKALAQGKDLSFFGFSRLFTSSGSNSLGDEDSGSLIKSKGKVLYGFEDGSLVIRVEKPRELERTLGSVIYIFGYSTKTPFAQMPKIRIVTRYNRSVVFDGGRISKCPGATADLDKDWLTLKIPLKILGSPDFILTAVNIYKGISQIDATGFRKIEIR